MSGVRRLKEYLFSDLIHLDSLDIMSDAVIVNGVELYSIDQFIFAQYDKDTVRIGFWSQGKELGSITLSSDEKLVADDADHYFILPDEQSPDHPEEA